MGRGIAHAVVLAAASAVIAASLAAQPPSAPVPLTVHEWGTFTSVAGPDGQAVRWLPQDAPPDLPCFVERNPLQFKGDISGTVRMETPVLYFYAPRAMDASVDVRFPQGLITEWYPSANYEVYQASGARNAPRRLATNLNGIDTSLRSVTGVIDWDHINVKPNTSPGLPLESGPSRYYAARETDAA